MVLPRLTYVNKDYAVMRQELLAKVPLITNGRWTDINESNPGIAMLELFVAMQDLLLFYLDQSVNESQFITALQRRSVRNLSRLIDYYPASITSAIGVVDMDGHSYSFGGNVVLIPAYTQLSTSDGIKFVTTTLVGATGAPVDVWMDVLHNVKKFNVVQAGSTGVNGDSFTSDGNPSQMFKLSSNNIDASTVSVKVQNSLWQADTSFAFAELNSEVFVYSLNDQGNVFIAFGDGIFGSIPNSGAVISVQYAVSDGPAGNVGANKITKIVNSLNVYDAINGHALGTTANNFTVNNLYSTTPGLAAESIERTKQLAPASLSALYTAKSKDDYNTLVLDSNSSISHVNTWGEQEENPPNFKMFNVVQIVFSGRNVDNGSKPFQITDANYTAVKAGVMGYLNAGNKKIITTRNLFVDPTYVHVVVTGTIFIDQTQFDPKAVLASVRAALADKDIGAFRFDVVSFGQNVYPSQVEQIISSVVGVSWVKVSLTPYVDGVVSPSRIVENGGIAVHKNELLIFEEDAITGFSSGLQHNQLTTTDTVVLPNPDVLNPCPSPDEVAPWLPPVIINFVELITQIPSGEVGDSVVINGQNFAGTTSVFFNDNKSALFTLMSAIQIIAKVPTGATAGPIRVMTIYGTAVSTENFTVTT